MVLFLGLAIEYMVLYDRLGDLARLKREYSTYIAVAKKLVDHNDDDALLSTAPQSMPPSRSVENEFKPLKRDVRYLKDSMVDHFKAQSMESLITDIDLSYWDSEIDRHLSRQHARSSVTRKKRSTVAKKQPIEMPIEQDDNVLKKKVYLSGLSSGVIFG